MVFMFKNIRQNDSIMQVQKSLLQIISGRQGHQTIVVRSGDCDDECSIKNP